MVTLYCPPHMHAQLRSYGRTFELRAVALLSPFTALWLRLRSLLLSLFCCADTFTTLRARINVAAVAFQRIAFVLFSSCVFLIFVSLLFSSF